MRRESGLVLVVDDSETMLYSKTRILRHEGFEVITATTGPDALRVVAERRPRLVLLDINLPGIDGWEVCRRIKANPETASTVVLQVSATYIHEADTVRSLEGGADGCLKEPLDAGVLVATVRALLRARQAEDAMREALAREQAARRLAESANRAKDEFLMTLSHELRSPLAAILTWVTLLRSGRATTDQEQKGLGSIERNARLQVRLIEDLLDASRIILGKMQIDSAVVGLPRVIEQALESVRPNAQAKDVALELELDPRLHPVQGDAARLHQVVWNVLSNAVKFTPRGGHVRVAARAVDSTATIEVRDDGMGIDATFLPQIFERFLQADASSTRAQSGLGLGLAIARSLVELHGGTIEAASAGPGHGSTFTIRLPLAAAGGKRRAGEAAAAAARAHAAELRLDGIRVLVVDDEADTREAVTNLLLMAGADVRTAPSVADAFPLLHDFEPHVLLSDIAMPGEDGIALIGRLRSESALPRVPAIAITAFAGNGTRERVRDAGFDAYLAKPVESGELLETITWLLSTSPEGVPPA